MNQLCKVCGEPAAGFHFGAFTCEGCKSFFGRTYNNISAIAGCKNNGDCVINKKNRTACKACRLRKCLLVGMSKSGSRYGRRSNWFKIHCLLQEQQQQTYPPVAGEAVAGEESRSSAASGVGGAAVNFEQLARLHQMQARQTYQDKTNPCIKSASISPTLGLTAASLSQQAAAVAAAAAAAAAAHQQSHQQTRQRPPSQQQQQQQRQPLSPEQPLRRLPPHCHHNAAKFLNGVTSSDTVKTESRLSAATPSDSGASCAGDVADDCHSSCSNGCGSNQSAAGRLPSSGISNTREEEDNEHNQPRHHQLQLQQHQLYLDFPDDFQERRRQHFLHIFRSHSKPLQIFDPTKSPFASFAISSLPPPPRPVTSTGTAPVDYLPGCPGVTSTTQAEASAAEDDVASAELIEPMQHEPIDLSLRARETLSRHSLNSPAANAASAEDNAGDNGDNKERATDAQDSTDNVIARPTPLDLTLVRTQSLTG